MTLLPTRQLATEYGAVRIAERAGTSAAAPLVLVHGYPDNLQIWSRLVAALDTDRRVIAFDWPGLGHSATFAGGATPFQVARQFIAVIDALGFDRVVPVGFDMGAHAIVAAAAREPGRIDRLVLTNFLADGTVPTSWDIDVMRKLGLNRLVLRYGTRIVFERAQSTFLVTDSLSCDVRDDLWSAFRRPEVRAHLRRMCVGYQAALPRVTRLYPEIEAETLIVWADSDPHFPLAQAHAVVDALPHASLDVIEHASHWFMWEAPGKLARSIEAFLNS